MKVLKVEEIVHYLVPLIYCVTTYTGRIFLLNQAESDVRILSFISWQSTHRREKMSSF